jgi:hypothetical protein
MATEPMDFLMMMKAVTDTIPGTWIPRREQPEWDRDFNGNADVRWHFAHRTDTAHQWLAFCLAFSDTLVQGFEGLDGVVKFGRETTTQYVPKGTKQFD